MQGTLSKLKKIGLKLGIITGGYEEDIEMIPPKTGIMPVLIRRRSSPTQRLYTETRSEIFSEIRTIDALDIIFEVLETANP